MNVKSEPLEDDIIKVSLKIEEGAVQVAEHLPETFPALLAFPIKQEATVKEDVDGGEALFPVPEASAVAGATVKREPNSDFPDGLSASGSRGSDAGPCLDSWSTELLMDYDHARDRHVCMVCGSVLVARSPWAAREHVRLSHPHSLHFTADERRYILEAWSERASLGDEAVMKTQDLPAVLDSSGCAPDSGCSSHPPAEIEVSIDAEEQPAKKRRTFSKGKHSHRAGPGRAHGALFTAASPGGGLTRAGHGGPPSTSFSRAPPSLSWQEMVGPIATSKTSNQEGAPAIAKEGTSSKNHGFGKKRNVGSIPRRGALKKAGGRTPRKETYDDGASKHPPPVEIQLFKGGQLPEGFTLKLFTLDGRGKEKEEEYMKPAQQRSPENTTTAEPQMGTSSNRAERPSHENGRKELQHADSPPEIKFPPALGKQNRNCQLEVTGGCLRRRYFQERWRTQFLVEYDWHSKGLVCMVCGKAMTTLRLCTIKRHAQRRHPHSLGFSPERKKKVIEAWEKRSISKVTTNVIGPRDR
ncbi:zinc finger translocation-associated protein isoform X2 [Latimeria chalumnae]|uniref:zinc finger translocation-associated protein isoform X2 n=1 Tax=Latimeria chalumnae TaxID=7897 RepID=UPI00313DD0B3